jgi:hypothetical protein
VWEGDCPSAEGTTLLCATCSRPAKPSCQMCPVRGEVSCTGVWICRVQWFAGSVEMPDRSDGVCQTTPATPTPPDHVRSVPRTTTQVCPHPRIPTVTDGDGPAHPWSMAQSIDRSIWRMLGLVSCHDAAPARRYPSRTMGALACGLPYLFPLLGACEDHPPPSTNSWSEVSLSF